MSNHPNRGKVAVSADPEFLLESAGRIISAMAKLVAADRGSEAFEKSRKTALRNSRLVTQSLQMMGPGATTAHAEAESHE